ncbi:MAG: spheroidene monooxygenase [Pseudomonadota bacterium]
MTFTPIVSLSFFRFSRLQDRLWAFAMMGLARRDVPKVPDIGFWKLCGSGTGEGFTPVPNTGVYAILASWPDLDIARDRIATAPLWQRYRARAAEDWTVFLQTTSARGQWSGQTPFTVSDNAPSGPIAALTRATVKPRNALKFWRRVPDISRMIGSDQNVAFKIGIGEVPLLHQITFSIWPHAGAMTQFARNNGPHAAAIRAVRSEDWFSEELYARFALLGEAGTWGGSSPLDNLERNA